MSLAHPRDEAEAVRRFRYWWPLRHAVTMGHWKRDREQRLITEDGLRKLIDQIRQFRRQAPKDPEKVDMGRSSQHKGRHAEHGERGVIRRWIRMGYKRTDILDRSEFEHSAQELGIDLVHTVWGITLQNKNFGPQPPPLRKQAMDAWDMLEHLTFKRFPELIPVIYWRNSKDEDHPTRDYAILRREDLEAILIKARPPND